MDTHNARTTQSEYRKGEKMTVTSNFMSMLSKLYTHTQTIYIYIYIYICIRISSYRDAMVQTFVGLLYLVPLKIIFVSRERSDFEKN